VIPGKSEKEPNMYPFGTSYDEIYEDLKKKDETLYTKNGMLHIMERNRRIKVIFSVLIPVLPSSVAEPHHVDAALAPGKNFDAAPATTLLLYSQVNILKNYLRFRAIFSTDINCNQI
jgi:Ssu72-like protein